MFKSFNSKIMFFVVILTIPSLVLSSVAYLKKPAYQIVNEMICKKKIRKIINKWGVTNEFQKQLSLRGSHEITILSPTVKFGKWVKMDISPSRVNLDLITQNSMIHVEFDKNCNKRMNTQHRRKALPKNMVTDVEIYKQIKKNKKGLFYIWAPNMPLSLDGIKEIEAAAKEKKLPLAIYLDSDADLNEAKVALKQRGLSSKYLKKYTSIEFDFRNARLHAPALLGYKNQKLLRHAKLGHEFKWKFIQYIDEMMK